MVIEQTWVHHTSRQNEYRMHYTAAKKNGADPGLRMQQCAEAREWVGE